MATGKIYLRPSADVSIGHPIYPTTLTAGYLAINEEVSDSSSTYIGVASDTNTTFEYASTFKLSQDAIGRITKVNSAEFFIDYGLGSAASSTTDSGSYKGCFLAFDVFVSGENVGSAIGYNRGKSGGNDMDFIYNGVTLSSGLFDGHFTSQSMVTALNDYISRNGAGVLPDMSVTLKNGVDKTGGSKDVEYSYTTQFYVELDCEYIPEIARKVEGEWKTAKKFYRKINRVWKRITADEAKQLIQSNTVINKCDWKGHAETDTIGIAATCLEPGTITGTHCSFCGVTIKEYNAVIPALGHTYNNVTGRCVRCDVYHEDTISFSIQRNSQTSATTYYAMPNITWRTWVTGQVWPLGGFQITSDNRIRYYSTLLSPIDYTVDNVTADDLIVAGKTYTATDAT